MSKILVTGGAGFIGSTLVDKLIEHGHDLVVVDNLVSGEESFINKKATFYKTDICSDKVGNIFNNEKPDYVFHLAAQIDVRKSVKDPVSDNKVNVLGALNILENARISGVRKIIFTSTGGAIYGDTDQIPTLETHPEMPLSPYGIHKLAFEKYLNYYNAVHNLKYTSLRFANVFGPRQYKGGEAGVISIFIDNAVNGKKSIINGKGHQTRDYVYVDDIVNALVTAMESEFVGEVNIGTEKEVSVLEVVDSIKSILGSDFEIEHGPGMDGEQLRSCLNSKKAREILGWKPKVSFVDGIRKTIEWSKNR